MENNNNIKNIRWEAESLSNNSELLDKIFFDAKINFDSSVHKNLIYQLTPSPKTAFDSTLSGVYAKCREVFSTVFLTYKR